MLLYGISAGNAQQVVKALTKKLEFDGFENDSHHDLRENDGVRRTSFARMVFNGLSAQQQVEAAELWLQLFRCNYQHPDSLIVRLLFYFVENSTACARAVARFGGVSALLSSKYAKHYALRCISLFDDTTALQEFVDASGVELLFKARASHFGELYDLSIGLDLLSKGTDWMTPDKHMVLHVTAGEALCRTISKNKYLQTITKHELDTTCIDLSEAATRLISVLGKMAQLRTDHANMYQQCAWNILHAQASWQPSTVQEACKMLLTCVDVSKLQESDVELLTNTIRNTKHAGVGLASWKLLRLLLAQPSLAQTMLCKDTQAGLAVCVLQSAFEFQGPERLTFMRDACRELYASNIQDTPEFVQQLGIQKLLAYLAVGVEYLQQHLDLHAGMPNTAHEVAAAVAMCGAVVGSVKVCSSSLLTASALFKAVVDYDGDLLIEKLAMLCSTSHKGVALSASQFVNTNTLTFRGIRDSRASAKAIEEKQHMLQELDCAKHEAQRCRDALEVSEVQHSAKLKDYAQHCNVRIETLRKEAKAELKRQAKKLDFEHKELTAKKVSKIRNLCERVVMGLGQEHTCW